MSWRVGMSKRRRRIAILATVAIAAVAIIAGWLLLQNSEVDGDWLVASGTVEATESQLGFQATGRIDAIRVREGDRVESGAEVADLDRTELLARREQASAQAAAAEAVLQELQSGFRPEEIAQARAALAAARGRRADAERDLERTRILWEGGAVSREAYDKAELALELARSDYEQAEEQVRLLEAGPRKERIEAQRAQVKQAQASVRAIDAALANMKIVTPFRGVVTVRHREPGEIVPPGSPVLTLMNPDDRWVRIYVREDRIGAVHVGQSATITSDTYPDRRYAGEVVFIASEAEFTPKNVQTTEERVKLVYAVKVRITGDPTHDLKPGMPADVRIRVGGEP